MSFGSRWSWFAIFAVLATPSLATAATLEPVYLDSAGEGFFSNAAPHAESQADGNPGETLGEQRQWAFEKALEFWGLRLESAVTIRVEAKMNDLDCDQNSAVLGLAGANSVHANWSPGSDGSAPAFADTLYGQALANAIAAKDNCPPDMTCEAPPDDIGSTFNKRIDESNNCLGMTVWYYALGDAPSGTISFFKVVLHEIGHGINFQTFVDLETGERLSGFDDIYMRFLEDHSTGKRWHEMTDAERQASATDSDDLHWVGPEVLAALSELANGTSAGHVKMHAPAGLKPGSSVSHWHVDVDAGASAKELMRPSASGVEKLLVTDELLHDLGWNDVPAANCEFADQRLTVGAMLSGTVNHEACVSITYDGASVDSGNTSALAGQQVILQGGFSVKQGAIFSVQTDPMIGL